MRTRSALARPPISRSMASTSDRLAGAGLAGQDVETGLELDFEVVDDRQMCARSGSGACRSRNSHDIRPLTALWSRATLPRNRAVSQRRTDQLYWRCRCARLESFWSWRSVRRLPRRPKPHRLPQTSSRSILHASPFVQFVLLVLLSFSAASWGIIVYKQLQFRRAARQTASFLDVFRQEQSLLRSARGVRQPERRARSSACFRPGYAELNAQLPRRRRGRQAGDAGAASNSQEPGGGRSSAAARVDDGGRASSNIACRFLRRPRPSRRTSACSAPCGGS